MDKQDYFSPKLTGGAISQRGFRYQTLVSIKYLIDSLNNPEFDALAAEQEDDFTLHFEKMSILCQVKSVLYNMNDLRKYLCSVQTTMTPRILICSAFSNEIQNLIEARKWYKSRMDNHRSCARGTLDQITENYKAQLEKRQINFDAFQAITLDSIPVEYAETIVRSSIAAWAQKHKQNLNIEMLLEVLYLEISKISAVRGVLRREDILGCIDRCVEKRDDIYTNLGLMELAEESSRGQTSNRQIHYTESRTSESICIKPSMRYWDDILQNKKPMIPICYVWEPFVWDFPNMDIKVLNSTNKTLFLSGIVFDVAHSIPDPSPILYIEKPAFASNSRHLDLHNDGWGILKNVIIRINCSPSTNTNFDTFGASKALGVIEESLNIDLGDMLHTLTGINFDAFDKALSQLEHSHDYYIDPSVTSHLFKSYLGDYFSGVAHVNGILDFDSDTVNEKNRHYSIYFSAAVDLYNYAYEGVPAPPSYQYDITLRVSDESYTVHKPISQVLKPGEADRFNVRIHCAQSAKHVMNIYLTDVTGRKIPVESNVQLEVCIPRSGIQFIEARTTTQTVFSGNATTPKLWNLLDLIE